MLRDFSGEANAGCLWLADGGEAPKIDSEKCGSATKAKSSNETQISDSSTGSQRTRAYSM